MYRYFVKIFHIRLYDITKIIFLQFHGASYTYVFEFFNGCCYYDIDLCAKILTITIFNNKTNIDKTIIYQNTMLTNQQLIDLN